MAKKCRLVIKLSLHVNISLHVKISLNVNISLWSSLCCEWNVEVKTRNGNIHRGERQLHGQLLSYSYLVHRLSSLSRMKGDYQVIGKGRGGRSWLTALQDAINQVKALSLFVCLREASGRDFQTTYFIRSTVMKSMFKSLKKTVQRVHVFWIICINAQYKNALTILYL